MADDLLGMIWEALGDDVVTTGEAAGRLESAFGYRCPDDLAKTFMKYRSAGRIKGRISMDRGGWVWWVDDECRGEARRRPTTRTRTSPRRGRRSSPPTSTA